MKLFKTFLHMLWIAFLTAFTQVGGLIWILTLMLCKFRNLKKTIAFPILYLVFNLIIIPPIAEYFGRVQLPVFKENLKPRNLFYPLLFRNYVVPELNKLLIESSQNLVNDNIKIVYLDANFPFFDGFPLLPHRSHNDGKKIDICFIYKTKNGKITDEKPALSGYGVYVKDKYSSQSCIKKGYWQYDFTKYLTLGKINDLDFDTTSTKKLILTFISKKETQKIFIEPYLKQNLGLINYNKIRFHGCNAVRHDDHIHLQVK
ncbi:hypothetical protein [Lacinutrix jangbogonensis]|uniref:hypothetical protein n=1 Tax=Lacinutrix jangbogonensis TaxID=1469557 RepID=UPI00053DB9FC|nr:hypothetical protein [Lacinutrix jangbogonensis]